MQKQTMHIKTPKILKFFLGTDEDTDTLIMCRNSEIDLVTYDYELYEALGSIKEYDNFQLNRLIKFLESVDIVSYRKNAGKEKPILTHEKVEDIRKEALKKNNME